VARGRGELTAKQLSFVEAYMGEAEFNATKAYEMSEYTCTTKSKATIDKTVSELLNHPLIQAEIKRRMAVREAKSEVKAEYLIIKLMQIVESEQERNPQAALRAIELAGKSIALWKERQEISGPDGDAIRHEQHIKESAADFTDKLKSLTRRATGTDGASGAGNVVKFPNGTGEGGT
jgi:phage terminase small subunit